MDIVSRMKQYMEYKQLTSSQFADNAGIPRPTLSQLFNGRNKTGEGSKKISSDIIRKLHEAFPRLNVMWLLFGDGDMETNVNNEISEDENDLLLHDINAQKSDSQELQKQILFEDDLQDLESEKIETTKKADLNKFDSAGNNIRSRKSYVPHTPSVSVTPNGAKKVESIMVFYSDSSFEVFRPSE